MNKYSEQFRNPLWQKFRLECLNAANWTCIDCGATTRELHVHHPYYVKDRSPWMYPQGVMMVLCNECHTERHSAEPGAFYDNWEWLIAAIGPLKWEDVECSVDYAQREGLGDIADIFTEAIRERGRMQSQVAVETQ